MLEYLNVLFKDRTGISLLLFLITIKKKILLGIHFLQRKDYVNSTKWFTDAIVDFNRFSPLCDFPTRSTGAMLYLHRAQSYNWNGISFFFLFSLIIFLLSFCWIFYLFRRLCISLVGL